MPRQQGPAARRTGRACDQGRIERAAIAAQLGRNGAEPRGAIVGGAGGIEAFGQRDLGRGQRAGLVGAQDRHGAEIVDRGQALDDHLARRHAQRAARQGDGGDHRQQLGRQADRQRHREHQRFQHRPAEQHVRGQHHQDQRDGEPRDQQAERAQVALERRRRLAFRQRRGGRAEQRGAAGADDQRQGLAGLGDGAAEQGIAGLAGIARGDDAGPLLDRIGLAGQRRLAGGEGRRLEQQRIGRDDVAGAHADDVARHDGIDFDPHEGAVALDLGLERHRAAQDLGRLDGAAFLEGVEADRERQDRHDDRAADVVAGRRRHDAGRQENERQRLEQSPQDRAGHARALGRGVGVGTVLFQARHCFPGPGRRQPGPEQAAPFRPERQKSRGE